MKLLLFLSTLIGCPIAVLVAVGATREPAADPEPPPAAVSLTDPSLSYAQRRAVFQTRLVRRGPAPQEWWEESPPARVREVTYESGDLELKAWIQFPSSPARRHPALVYFHGGFSFSASDLGHCRQFHKAGFVVMCPMLRGENGNPGSFEMFYGEIDDAKAAVHWLAQQPFVDTGQIYTFGHGPGGAISALLSLLDDVPARHGGSAGGLYGSAAFDRWKHFVPFNRGDPMERQMRSLIGNIRYMRRPHYAYIGRGDMLQRNLPAARREIAACANQLVIVKLDGDQLTSLRPALYNYLRLIQGEFRRGN